MRKSSKFARNVQKRTNQIMAAERGALKLGLLLGRAIKRNNRVEVK
jgi:hypothetical protein